MHWSVLLTAIIGFEKVQFFLQILLLLLRSFVRPFIHSFDFSTLLFSGTKRNESKPPPLHQCQLEWLFIRTPLQNSFISFAHAMARNKHSISKLSRAELKIECEWIECVPFYFSSLISTWLHFFRSTIECRCVWICAWTVSANRSSFSFSIKCTSVTFNLIWCFAGSKRFVLSSASYSIAYSRSLLFYSTIQTFATFILCIFNFGCIAILWFFSQFKNENIHRHTRGRVHTHRSQYVIT